MSMRSVSFPFALINIFDVERVRVKEVESITRGERQKGGRNKKCTEKEHTEEGETKV